MGFKRLSEANLLSEREKQNRDFMYSLISFLKPLVRKQEACFLSPLLLSDFMLRERGGFFP